MDFDREYELENAGIDAFDFALMDEDERAETLRDAGLDPDDYDGVKFDSSFDAWSALQDNGLSLWELDLMDEDEKKAALDEAGLDPEDYAALPAYTPSIAYVQGSVSKSSPSPDPIPREGDPIPSHQEPPMIYHFCSVVFPGSNYPYAYLTDGLSVAIGDTVLVPTGPNNKPQTARVVSVGSYTAESAPYPVEEAKTVLRLAVVEDASWKPDISDVPRSWIPVQPQEEKQKPVLQLTTAEEDTPHKPAKGDVSEKPISVPPQNAVEKSGHGAWWFAVASVLVLLIVIVVSQQQSTALPSTGGRTREYGSTSSYYAGSTSTTPTCPPVNREKALTKEEADRLRGTGYNGTRPNSSAENTELAAAQTKCKNCGYRTHNGLNSLCDYCAWMKKYGSGLPASARPTATPRPTVKPTPRPSTKPRTDDPYHASDYYHADDFYYDYYDDFWDYEDAEDYWKEHNG